MKKGTPVLAISLLYLFQLGLKPGEGIVIRFGEARYTWIAVREMLAETGCSSNVFGRLLSRRRAWTCASYMATRRSSLSKRRVKNESWSDRMEPVRKKWKPSDLMDIQRRRVILVFHVPRTFISKIDLHEQPDEFSCTITNTIRMASLRHL